MMVPGLKFLFDRSRYGGSWQDAERHEYERMQTRCSLLTKALTALLQKSEQARPLLLQTDAFPRLPSEMDEVINLARIVLGEDATKGNVPSPPFTIQEKPTP